jgi:hypothetical protein
MMRRANEGYKMTDSSFDKVAAAVEKQGEAIKSFRKRQDERISDMTKRIEKIEALSPTIIDSPGYGQMFDSCADMVDASPHPRLAAAALLNAALSINLSTMGADALADILRQTADRVPGAEVKAKNRLT